MPIDIEEFLRGISMLADNQNCRVTVKQSLKGAAVCGGITFLGIKLNNFLFFMRL